jgi:hypothetical protein
VALREFGSVSNVGRLSLLPKLNASHLGTVVGVGFRQEPKPTNGVSTMTRVCSIFSQILKLVPRQEFEVARPRPYQGERHSSECPRSMRLPGSRTRPSQLPPKIHFQGHASQTEFERQLVMVIAANRVILHVIRAPAIACIALR